MLNCFVRASNSCDCCCCVFSFSLPLSRFRLITQNLPTTGSKLSEMPSLVMNTRSPSSTKVIEQVRLCSCGFRPSTGPNAPPASRMSRICAMSCEARVTLKKEWIFKNQFIRNGTNQPRNPLSNAIIVVVHETKRIADIASAKNRYVGVTDGRNQRNTKRCQGTALLQNECMCCVEGAKKTVEDILWRKRIYPMNDKLRFIDYTFVVTKMPRSMAAFKWSRAPKKESVIRLIRSPWTYSKY